MFEDLLPRLIQPLLSVAVGPVQAQLLVFSVLGMAAVLAGWMAARAEWRAGEPGRARQASWIAALLCALALPLQGVGLEGAVGSFAVSFGLALVLIGTAGPLSAGRSAAAE